MSSAEGPAVILFSTVSPEKLSAPVNVATPVSEARGAVPALRGLIVGLVALLVFVPTPMTRMLSRNSSLRAALNVGAPACVVVVPLALMTAAGTATLLTPIYVAA